MYHRTATGSNMLDLFDDQSNQSNVQITLATLHTVQNWQPLLAVLLL